jgi:hypothetical protein
MKTPDEIRQLAIEGCINEKAHDDLGIYPQAVSGGANAYEKRSDYQNGWNDAIMRQTQKAIRIHNFLDTLSKEQRTALETLLLEDVVQLSDRDDKMYMWLNVNDIFYYAADGEDFEVNDLLKLTELYEKYDWAGIIAWVAKKRNMEPLPTKYKKTDKYLEAFKSLGD